VNLQIGTSDLHHLDIAWDPSTMQQRNGRAVRQGNKKGSVRIHTYLSRGSFDGYRYQAVAAKKSWQDLLWKGGDTVENLERPTITPEEMMCLMSDDPEGAKAAIDANKEMQQARYHAMKTAEASKDFVRYQTMKHNLALTKDKTSYSANMAALKIGKAKVRLQENPYFTAKPALDSPNVVLLHPESGTIMERGTGIERDGKKYVVMSVDPKDQSVYMRSYGGVGPTSHALSLKMEEMGPNVKAFAYHEPTEVAEMTRQFGDYADSEAGANLNMEAVRNLPQGVLHANYKKIQARLKRNIAEHKIDLPRNGSMGFINTTNNEATAEGDYRRGEYANSPDHEVMLPTPEHRARMMAEYAKFEQGRELRSGDTKWARGKRLGYGPMHARYKRRADDNYHGEDENPWAKAGEHVFGYKFPKEAHAAFQKNQAQLIRHAKTFTDALRAAAPSIELGNAAAPRAKWPESTIATLFARAKRQGILDKPMADMVPREEAPPGPYGFRLGPEELPNQVWQSTARDRKKSTTNLRDLSVREALDRLAVDNGHTDLAAAMIVSGHEPHEAATRLLKLPLGDDSVIAAVAHLAAKHPELAATKVKGTLMTGEQMTAGLGHDRDDMTFGQIPNTLRIRAGRPPEIEPPPEIAPIDQLTSAAA
jgi:hypothetical protein